MENVELQRSNSETDLELCQEMVYILFLIYIQTDELEFNNFEKKTINSSKLMQI